MRVRLCASRRNRYSWTCLCIGWCCYRQPLFSVILSRSNLSVYVYLQMFAAAKLRVTALVVTFAMLWRLINCRIIIIIIILYLKIAYSQTVGLRNTLPGALFGWRTMRRSIYYIVWAVGVTNMSPRDNLSPALKIYCPKDLAAPAKKSTYLFVMFVCRSISPQSLCRFRCMYKLLWNIKQAFENRNLWMI